MMFLLISIIFSDSLIYNSDVKYKELAIAISVWETGHYSSNAYKNNNNLFGWRRNGKNIRFKNKEASVKAYSHFEQRIIKKYNITSEKQYLNIITKFYAKDKKRWKQKVLNIWRKHYLKSGQLKM